MIWIRRYINQKKVISKISVDSNFTFTIMCIGIARCSIDICVKLSLVEETYVKIALSFHSEMISA